MSDPQFKGSHTSIFNPRIIVSELRRTDIRSLIVLYSSIFLMLLGFVLIFMNNMNVLAPGTYFGAYSFVTVIVFTIGILINFVSIPSLYFSSFKDFKKENDFWDKEMFWILPFFFFGTFFLYGSDMAYSLSLMSVSLAAISLVHFFFMTTSKKFIMDGKKEEEENHRAYFENLQYLTFYYLLLFFGLVWYNPIQSFFIWVRFNL